MKLILSMLLLAYSGIAVADGLPQYRRARVFTSGELKAAAMRSLRLDPELYGGRPIRSGELKPSVNIGNCTGTVVGPKVLLTAGHCRASGSKVNFTYAGRRYSGDCTRHPNYSQNGWLNNDFSLCKLGAEVQDMPVYANMKPITMNAGDTVTMQGYGAGSGGKLNVGEAAVLRVDNMDIITRGNVRLGGGDSGGALFAKVPNLVNGPFNIVGVNSRGDRRDTSYFNRLDLDRSQKFFSDYASAKAVKICGINASCGGENPNECPTERLSVINAQEILAASERDLAECLNQGE